MTLVCDACGVWPLEQGVDRFCGWCGTPLLEVVLERESGEPIGDRLRDYVHAGQRSLRYVVRQRGAAAGAPPTVTRIPGDEVAEVAPAGATGRFGVTLRAPSVSGATAVRVSLRVECPPVAARTLALELWPVPELVPSPNTAALQGVRDGRLHAAFLDSRATTERLVVRLVSAEAPVVPTRVGIRAGSSDVVVWDTGGTVTTDELIVRLPDIDREVGLDRDIPVIFERRGPWERGRTMPVEVVIGLDGLADRTLSLTLAQRRHVRGDFSPARCDVERAYVGRAMAFACHLANDDDLDLRFVGAAADVPWLRVTEYAPGIRPEELQPLRFPVHLAAAGADGPPGTCDFAIVVDGTHPGFPSESNEEHHATVMFERPDGGATVYPVRIGAISRAQSLSLQGYLAIDFGTTSTCCAIKLEEREVAVVPFGTEGRSAVPSVIFFEDLSDPANPRYRIGAEALAEAKRRGERCLVRNFKRRIGLDVREPVVDPEGRTAAYLPEELTALYLRAVLREVREHLGRGGEPIEVDAIFFTYPVLFSPRQVQMIEAVFADLGMKEVIPALDEASAGAIQYVHGWANEAYRAWLSAGQPATAPTTEYVLNYDFGGGTIDIALLEVTRDFVAGEVRSTPIGVTGLYRFGGADITVIARQLLVRKIEAAMRRHYTRFSLPCGDLSDPPGLYQAKRENNARLEFLAEKAKIAAFTTGRYDIERGDPDLDGLWVDRGDGSGLERVDPVSHPLFDQLDEADARITLRMEELDEVIGPHLGASVDRAYNLWRSSVAGSGGAGLSRILLTGRSSGIPLVRRLMGERLGVPADRIVHDPDRAKEVVAQGACYFRRLWSVMLTGLRFNLGDATRRMLIPIGIEKIDFAESVFHTIFPNGLLLEERTDSIGNTRLYAERGLEFGLGGPIASLKVFRSVDYVDPITSGGKDLIARFEFRASDPYFAEWTPEQRRAFRVTFGLWKSAAGGEHHIEVVVVHPVTGAQKVFRSVFHDDLVATVGAAEEAAGLLEADARD